ncbi:MAG: hypothetical protein DM484_06400 [Candidatus Methylumidiphilus alinenensis]|uniref:Uncharacterized protein n=1 Tax=Candidatus Methylumidiphilus alinenensis TaxID=2202197 RepID=A0A2W4TCW5_9GAMM|nr:MAG: hypothetical protein DM484_06400 [Candidatus Methylumidiphilus alinenensis]
MDYMLKFIVRHRQFLMVNIIDSQKDSYLTDVRHGVAKLALPAKASLDTPKQIAIGRQPIADNSTVVCAYRQSLI